MNEKINRLHEKKLGEKLCDKIEGEPPRAIQEVKEILSGQAECPAAIREHLGNIDGRLNASSPQNRDPNPSRFSGPG